MKPVLIFLLLVSLYSSSSAQRFLQSEKTLGEIKEACDAYYDAILSSESEESEALLAEGGEYRQYMQWMRHWEPRIGLNNKYEDYFLVEKNYYESSSSSLSIVSPAPWSELGPTRAPLVSPLVGTTWTGIGPIEFIQINKIDPAKMLCASTTGGLFYSDDEGESWVNAGTDVGWTKSGCGWAEFHPTDVNTWYASSANNGGNNEPLPIGYTDGIYRTTNTGTNWTKIASHSDLGGIWTKIQKLVIRVYNNGSDHDMVLAATSGGLYINNQAEGTGSWDNVLTFNDQNIYDIELKPGDNNTLYLTAADYDLNTDVYSNWKIWKGTVAGTVWTWTEINTTGIITANTRWTTIEVSPGQPDLIYCHAGLGSNSNLRTYNTSTSVWDFLTNSTSIFGGHHSFGVNASGDGIFVAHDLAARRHIISTAINSTVTVPHDDLEDFHGHPTNHNIMWAAHHGGIAKSTNCLSSPITWTDKSDGLGVAQVEGMATSYDSPDYIATGLYHDGTLLTESPYSINWQPDWIRVMGGDGFRPVIDNLDSKYMWASSQNNTWSRSEDRYILNSTNLGSSCTSASTTTFFNSYGILNKVESNNFYLGYKYSSSPYQDEVRRSANRGSSCQTITAFHSIYPGDGLMVLGFYNSPTDKNTMYVKLKRTYSGGEEYLLFRTRLALASGSTILNSWVSLPLPRGTIEFNDVEVDAENPDKVYIVYTSDEMSDPGIAGIGMIYNELLRISGDNSSLPFRRLSKHYKKPS